jgi:transposase
VATPRTFLAPVITTPIPLPRSPSKKHLADTVARKQAAAPPGVTVELWGTDQHRVGLKAILRRVWAPKGTRPQAIVRDRYEWLYVYAFLHPRTGEVHWLFLPRVTIDVFSIALAHFAQLVGAGATKQILLVLDQAGWHTSPQVDLPGGIELLFQPSHSPELQPTERLWPLTNEVLANRTFDTLADLDQALGERCVALSANPEAIRALTHYHWWPDAA